MSGKYKVSVVCANCNFNSEIEIEKGKRVETHLCPTCGCKTLKKIEAVGFTYPWPVTRPIEPYKPYKPYYCREYYW